MELIPIRLTYNFNDQEVILHPTIIKAEEGMWLVDCGYEGSLSMIKDEFSKRGLKMEDLDGVIISHDDIDHLGALKEIKDAFPWIKVYSSDIEAPYVSGYLKSLRLQQAEDLFPSLPEEHRAWATAFQAQLRSVKRVPVDQTFSIDEIFSKGIQIINTPGHTPGHISIYLPDLKILIASDAIVIGNGELGIANPQFCLDLHEAKNSVKKLSALEIEIMVCYHGGIETVDISTKLLRLISGI
ncbi:MAG TPA: MBL fold metallo-hydrolase [Chitinophagaceae bacterium]|nr:MBL fold metallo-hydrolase [Chitinophagaceae bacterium]